MIQAIERLPKVLFTAQITTNFGVANIAADEQNNLCWFDFASNSTQKEMQKKWHCPIKTADASVEECWAEKTHKLFSGTRIEAQLNLCGTEWQKQVWKHLLQTERGDLLSYSELAQRIRKPNSVRAVARAVASNYIALFIPCHRVIHKNNSSSGYRWGIEIKQKIIDNEKNH